YSFYPSLNPPHLHSFPTRRSSDLKLSDSTFDQRLNLARLHHVRLKGDRATCFSDDFFARRFGAGFVTMKIDGDPSAICRQDLRRDRKSTRLNSSHSQISYAVFCLK